MRTLVLVASILVASSAQADKKRSKRRGPYGPNSRVERPAEAHGAASLRLRSIDLTRKQVVVELNGFPRAPAGNLFVFTDDRGRKFIASSARCDQPFPSGTRVCDLETPDGYERHPWVELELHLHGLQSSTVAAPVAEVERAYQAARSADELGRSAEATPTPRPAEPAPAEPATREDESAK